MDKNKLIKAIEKINKIFQSNDISLVDEFEEEFIKLENEKETSSMIILDNRELIRKSFFALFILYGEKANLEDLKILINNTNGNGKKMIFELFKIITDNDNDDFDILMEDLEDELM